MFDNKTIAAMPDETSSGSDVLETPTKVKEKSSFYSNVSRFVENAPRHRQISCNAALSKSSPAATNQMGLQDYLYQQGFLQGACSDVSFKAFGKTYNLHKLILHRSPYFSALFSKEWSGEESSDLGLEADDNITKEAFELALARLYGQEDSEAESEHLYGLFAVSSFLDLPELADSCVSQLIRSITADNVSEIVTFACQFDYGKSSVKVLDGCKSFLSSELLEMTFDQLDLIPEQVVAEIISSDRLFVPSEWQRCCFILDLYNEKAKRTTPINEDALETIQHALNTGIHFCHLSSDKLFELERVKDVQGKPLINRAALRDGLWLQHELRQRVTNAQDVSLGLGEEQDIEEQCFPIPCEKDEPRFTRFPPVRFSVEFEDVASLVDRERRYSDTIWAFGSFWSVYIQKSIHKRSPQLGVYLYRCKLDQQGNIVQSAPSSFYSRLLDQQDDGDEFGLTLGSELTETLGETQAPPPSLTFSPLRVDENANNNNTTFAAFGSPAPSPFHTDAASISSPTGSPRRMSNNSTSQPTADYVDRRKRIDAYFEIFTPARRNDKTSMTAFSSPPDKFDFAQSWGWKSSSLAATGDKSLKFMIVIGII